LTQRRSVHIFVDTGVMGPLVAPAIRPWAKTALLFPQQDIILFFSAR
jgi:hypothetical protein